MSATLRLYRSAEIRALEHVAIEQHGIAGGELMRRAAEGAWRALRQRWSAARELLVLCGGGNNGGDGYALAAIASRAGLTVRVVAVVPEDALQGDAAAAMRACLAAGIPISSLDLAALSKWLESSDVIVDALLGIGLKQTVRTPLAEVIEAVNASGRPVLALDVPSGLSADTGLVQGVAIRAALTVTFIGYKLGLFIGEGPQQVGELKLDRLQLDHLELGGVKFESRAPAVAELLNVDSLTTVLPPRRPDSHKGDGGHVVIVGGGRGMPGAARLAGESALRMGAGRVTVLCHPSSVAAIAAGRAELMVHGIERADEALPVLAAADVRLVGPGLGRDDSAFELLKIALDREAACVLDADALTLLPRVWASWSQAPAAGVSRGAAELPWVLTPHPGEAATLLASSARSGQPRGAGDIQTDRLAALAHLVDEYSAVVVLKGAGTWVGGRGRTPALCAAGNATLATAGTGDVLAGAIAGVLAQRLRATSTEPPAANEHRDALWESACAGVWWHAACADRWQRTVGRGGSRGLLASELALALGTGLT